MQENIFLGQGDALCPLKYIRFVPEIFMSGPSPIMCPMLICFYQTVSFFANFGEIIWIYDVRRECVKRRSFFNILLLFFTERGHRNRVTSLLAKIT